MRRLRTRDIVLGHGSAASPAPHFPLHALRGLRNPAFVRCVSIKSERFSQTFRPISSPSSSSEITDARSKPPYYLSAISALVLSKGQSSLPRPSSKMKFSRFGGRIDGWRAESFAICAALGPKCAIAKQNRLEPIGRWHSGREARVTSSTEALRQLESRI